MGDNEEYDERVVIIDNGSWTTKAGLSTDDLPTCVFPGRIGKPRKVWEASLDKTFYVGEEIDEVRDQVNVCQPFENGIIENFDQMEAVWAHTFEKMGVNPENHAVLLTEPPYNPKAARECMVEKMFEIFGVPALNISIQGVLALLGQGRTTGLVLDSGEGVTHTIPIFEGYALPVGINRLELAGRELNTLLAKLVAQDGPSLTSTSMQYQARLMKEAHCYVALDPTKEEAETVEYKLPDCRAVSLADERWQCPEALFNPSSYATEAMGVGGLVWESITACEIDVRKTLLQNVVLSGGSTMFPGFAARLGKEVKGHAPTAMQAQIRIVQSKDQKSAVWVGAQVSASLRSCQEDKWMTYDDYEEYGANFVHEKVAIRYG